MEKISIIIPAYNAERYLYSCLDSIINQSVLDFEVIIVDDGSTDSTWNICESYMKKDSRIRAVHQENSGSVNARKQALQLATGDYVTSVDADDWIHVDRLKNFYSIISEYGPDAIVASFINVENDNYCKHLQQFQDGFYSRSDMEKMIFPNMLSTGRHFTFGIMPSLWGCCIKREILLNNYSEVPTDISLGDDACITYPCILDANSIYISNDYGYYYRTNDNSMTHTWNPRIFVQVENLFTYLENVARKKKWNATEQLNEYRAFITWVVVRKALLSVKDKKSDTYKELDDFIRRNRISVLLKSICIREMSFKRRIIYLLIRNRRWSLLASIAQL